MISAENPRISYVGDAVEDEFNFTFRVFLATDILVYVTDVLQTLNVHYTVTLNAGGLGGKITFIAAYIPAAAAVIDIVRSIPLTQDMDLVEGDRLPAETVESTLDRQTMALQDMDSKLDLLIAGGGVTPIPTNTILAMMGYIDVRRYASLNAAVTALGSTVCTVFVPNAQTLTANLTIPSTMSLVIPKGGSIVKAGAFVVAINGPFEAGLYQVFSGFAAGDVTFGAGAVKEVYPEWWGNNTIPGTTDMSQELGMAIDSLPVTGGQVRISNNDYLISSVVGSLDNKSNIKIMGYGKSSILRTTGANNNIILRMDSCTDIEITGIHFISNFAGTNASDQGINTNPAGSNIFIHHCFFTTLSAGIVFTDGGNNINITHNYFDRCNSPIQHGTGAQTTQINISDNTFVGTDSFDCDDAIAISGTTKGVIIARNHIDKKGSAASTKLKGKGILIEASEVGNHNEITISENIILNCDTTNVLKRSSIEVTSVLTYRTDNITISNNKIDTNYSGIKIESLLAKTIKIDGNVITNSTYRGVDVPADPGGLTDISITNNTINTAGSYGISCTNGDGIIVEGNTVLLTTNAGIIIDTCSDVEIVNNKIKGGTTHAIIFSASPYPIFVGNRILDNGGYGINFSGTGNTNPYFSGNHINGNTSGEINNLSEQFRFTAADATPSVRNGNTFLTGGADTYTDFDDGIEGQKITIIAEHAATVTDGTNIFLSGSANFVMGATDTLTLIQKADGKWYELSRSDN